MSRPNFHINLNEPSKVKKSVNSKALGADEYDEDTLMSYQEWKDAGYFVVKGSKSRCRDAVGECQFSLDQVEKAKPRLKYGHTTANLAQCMSDAAECDANETDIY